MHNRALFPLAPGQDQFRLVRIQTFNWGTFSGVCNFDIAEKGHLFLGPSGSGKSTILDAHAALLTPPKWLDFNVAAREAERHGRDRSAMSYVRGAWAEQTGDDGEYVAQYLRNGTTWSAIAETYRYGNGKVVVLAEVLWIRGASIANTDVHKRFLVLERDFDVRELQPFASSDYDARWFKRDLPDAFVRDEFSPYQERFRRLLGIESERALRLLHKTQSAKNLGDLNTFLRDFMLDAPETFVVADRLVAEFGELNAAHQAVVAARRQIETLEPARDSHEQLVAKQIVRRELDELGLAVQPYRRTRRQKLLEARLVELAVDAEAGKLEAQRCLEAEQQEGATLRSLQDHRRGCGGALIEELEQQAKAAEQEKQPRLDKRSQAEKACALLGWTLPSDGVEFPRLAEKARQRLSEAGELEQELESRRDALKRQQDELASKLQAARREIEAMERQRSNIPSEMLDIRSAIARAVGVGEESLPFVGELLEVRPEERRWQGAIERVLHGFALSLLVEDKMYAAVSSFVDRHHFGKRVVYLRVLPELVASRSTGPGSLVAKLSVAGGAYADWLKAELGSRFDYQCAETEQAFRAAPKAVSLLGQVKHNSTRHEKDDRHRVDDRAHWVLGFDNHAKLELFKGEAQETAVQLASVVAQLAAAKQEGAQQREQTFACQMLGNLRWADVDFQAVVTKVDGLRQRIAQEKAARPDLAELDRQISQQERRHAEAQKATRNAGAKVIDVERETGKHRRKLDELQLEPSAIALTPLQAAALERRFSLLGCEITLDSLDQAVTRVVQAIGEEKERVSDEMAALGRAIEDRFKDFNRDWPAEAGGLDPTLASADDYFAKLTRLETDGLPKFEARFLELLRNQSDQNLMLLSTRLDQERKAIRDRMDLVNESLATAPFNPGTHLVIETSDRMLEDVRAFKQDLKRALSHSFSSDPAAAEERFGVLNTLVRRLSSQDSADKSWRLLVLDVRQHVEFVAKELDETGVEVEVYRSGAGKSGGQRQKLAATCLAAALRYQLGGQDRGLPSFSTVALDEAMDKSDAEFTALAMNIFKTFGFQMVVATPLKSVMTLEPFVGGACFVHIRDRKSSAVIPIAYDDETMRLQLASGIEDGESQTAVS
jgi:uncharacterized protein YPO0396